MIFSKVDFIESKYLRAATADVGKIVPTFEQL